jgi:hypothetical protein
MHVAREAVVAGTDTAFEVLFACDRCGACLTRLEVYEPVN